MTEPITKEREFVAGLVINQLNSLISRSALSWGLDGPQRDLNKDCGYPRNVGIGDLELMIQREGIANRINRLYPEECWAVEPEVCETEDEGCETEFEQAFQDLEEKYNLFHYLGRADELSGIGRFGIILIGFDDGLPMDRPVEGIDEKGMSNALAQMEASAIAARRRDASNKQSTQQSLKKSTDKKPSEDDKPAPKKPEPKPEKPQSIEAFTPKRKITYLRVLSESYVTIATWEGDTSNPRYGQPRSYNIILAEEGMTGVATSGAGAQMATPNNTLLNVHWTRVIHIADNRKTSEVLGTPRLECVYNRLCDMRKLLGGSAEMFWKGAFPGISFEMDPTIVQDAGLDPVAVKREFQRYQDGLQRFLAIEGLHANSLSVQVADPEMHLKVQLQAIAIALAIPMRLLIGSEAAQLASGQDSKSWNKRVARRQNRYLSPMLIRPFIDRCIAVGVLPTPERYFVEWPDLNATTDTERADIAVKLSQAMAAYVGGNVETIMPPLEFLTTIIGLDMETAQFVIDAAMSVEELMTDLSDPEAELEQQQMQFDQQKELTAMTIGAKADAANSKKE